MFKNYLICAFNNLLKNKLFSLINIIGLSIGLAACILIALYVQNETSYDKHWQDSERIYRVNFSALMPGSGLTQFTEIPLIAMPSLAKYFQEDIEASTRIIWGGGIVRNGTAEFKQVLYKVDPQFTDIFSVDLVAGSLEETLSGPGNIALSTKEAMRFFGNENPIGKLLTIAGGDGFDKEYRVSAVYHWPNKTILQLPMLALLNEDELPEDMFTWISLSSDSYFKLKAGADIEQLNAQIANFTDQNVDVSAFFPDPDIITSAVALYSFQNMQDIYLNSPWDTFRELGNKSQVFAFSAIAVLVLLIACINFTALSTAKATQRAKEVAMRKVMGAERGQLVIQYLSESFVIVFLAILSSIAVVELFLPSFELLIGKNLEFFYTSPITLLSLLVLFLIVGILGGLYPALVLSSFYPAATLKAKQNSEARGAMSLRNILVTFQFGVSIALIIATSVIYLQVEYSSKRDPGFNQENLMVINQLDSRRELYGRVDTLKKEILNLAGVTSVALSTWQPSQKNQGFGSYDLLGKDAANYSIARTGIGYDFFATYQVSLLAGRDYSENLDLVDPIYSLDPKNPASEAHDPRNVIINASAAKQMNLGTSEQAIGRVFRSVSPEDGARNYTIVGVVADSHFYSINALPRAEVFHLTPNRPNIVTVRFQGSPQGIIEKLNIAWEAVMGDEELSVAFVDELLAGEFKQEKTEAKIFFSFSLLAILIACSGLYASASFTVEKRTKEIGIRKVMGAEISEIVSLLLWQFSKPVLLANLIAWPCALWAMLRWLQQFPYQINYVLLTPLCILAGTIALLIAWITVASNTYRVAKTKPVLALRYE